VEHIEAALARQPHVEDDEIIGLGAGAALALLEAWRFQIAFAGWGLGYGAALRITLAGLFVGSFTPGAVGSEVYKLYAVRGREPGVVRPLVKLAFLRLIGTLAVAVAAGGGWLAAPESLRGLVGRIAWRWPKVPAPALQGLRIGGAAAAVLGLAVLFANRKRIALRVRQGWDLLAGFQLRRVGEIFVLSLGIALLRGLSLSLLVRSLGERGRFGDLLVVVALSVLASALPISPAGLGVQEGVLAGCLVLLGMTPAPAVAIALLNRSFIWLLAAVGGWALAVSRPAHPPPPV